MPLPGQPAVKMVTVDAQLFEAIGYALASRQLFVKFRNGPTRCYEGVPNFRYQGLSTAPRKDAYFNTYIKNSFLVKDVQAGVA